MGGKTSEYNLVLLGDDTAWLRRAAELEDVEEYGG